jgi:hypothetical protein
MTPPTRQQIRGGAILLLAAIVYVAWRLLSLR